MRTLADAIRHHLDATRVIVTNDGERERIIAHVMIDLDHPRYVDQHHWDMWQQPVTHHDFYVAFYSDDDVLVFHEMDPMFDDQRSRFAVPVPVDYDQPDDALDAYFATFYAPHSESHAY